MSVVPRVSQVASADLEIDVNELKTADSRAGGPAVLFTMFEGDAIKPACFECKEPLKRLPVLRQLDSKHAFVAPEPVYLSCPKCWQLDGEGNPTGRLVSWAHNPMLVHFPSMMACQAYKAPSRDFYVRPSCSVARCALQIRTRAMALGLDHRINTPLFKGMDALETIIKSEGFLAGEESVVKRAHRLDVMCCTILDEIEADEFKKRTNVPTDVDEGGPSAPKRRRFAKLSGPNNLVRSALAIECFMNASCKLSACLTKKSVCIHRFTWQCMCWGCRSWSTVYSHSPLNEHRIFDCKYRTNGQAPIEAYLMRDYQQNTLPYDYILSEGLEVSPQEFKVSQQIAVNKISITYADVDNRPAGDLFATEIDALLGDLPVSSTAEAAAPAPSDAAAALLRALAEDA